MIAGIVVASVALLQMGPAGPVVGTDTPTSRIANGREVYAKHCAKCHGDNLQGQPDWQTQMPNGRMPAPPHDATGHAWHHADDVLFGITKNGLKPYVSADYESDMPLFGNILNDDDIGAVWDYIKSTWPDRQREHQERMTAQARAKPKEPDAQ